MIVEHTYDNRKICYGCKFLKLENSTELTGLCTCPDNKIRVRNRSITDKKCAFKTRKE
jgi:hypothetical protein